MDDCSYTNENNQRRLAKGDDDLYNLLHKEIKQAYIKANEA